jgi:hypothetical protein
MNIGQFIDKLKRFDKEAKLEVVCHRIYDEVDIVIGIDHGQKVKTYFSLTEWFKENKDG